MDDLIEAQNDVTPKREKSKGMGGKMTPTKFKHDDVSLKQKTLVKQNFNGHHHLGTFSNIMYIFSWQYKSTYFKVLV